VLKHIINTIIFEILSKLSKPKFTINFQTFMIINYQKKQCCNKQNIYEKKQYRIICVDIFINNNNN